MKSIKQFISKKYVFAIIVAALLSSCFTYSLLDAFVIQKVYGEQAENNSVDEEQNQETINAVITENSYKDDNIEIQIERVEEDRIVFYVADVKLSNVSYLKTAFAKGLFGKNITERTSKTAYNNNAFFAVNGDYYGFRNDGLIIRNGTLYRDVPRKKPYNETLAICNDGQLKIILEGEKTGEEFLNEGVLQTFAFGPTLVKNGKAIDSDILIEKSLVSTSPHNPRAGAGQISPLHYLFIVADGRTKSSIGMTLSRLAEEFEERDCTLAYNLDGGGSATMFFNGEVINFPTDGRDVGERKVSDIIYINGRG